MMLKTTSYNKLKITALFATSLITISGCSVNFSPDPNNGDNTSIDSTPYMWVAVGADSRQYAKFVTLDGKCPEIVIDGQSKPMQLRTDSKPQHFEKVTSCEMLLPVDVENVAINGQSLKVLPSQLNRIVVIGDTGCRMKSRDFQNCNNIEGEGEPWLFGRIVDAVNKEVSNHSVDLILHMGDFHYREAPCPSGNKGCVGPWGFNWATWQADFFEPAETLLPQVPWMLTRGNHEDCNRAFKGWFYLLDPNPLANDPWNNCVEYSGVDKLKVGDLTIVNMDSATLPNAYSAPVNPETTAKYVKMLDQVNQYVSQAEQSWMITHRPIWAISSYYDWKRLGTNLSSTDPTMQQAITETQLGKFDDNLSLLMAGHIHNFQAISFSDDRPSLMVIGDSGTMLSPPFEPSLEDKKQALLKELGVAPEDFFVDTRFAYVVLERQPHKQWLAKFVDIDGKVRKTFVLRGKRLQPAYEG